MKENLIEFRVHIIKGKKQGVDKPCFAYSVTITFVLS